MACPSLLPQGRADSLVYLRSSYSVRSFTAGLTAGSGPVYCALPGLATTIRHLNPFGGCPGLSARLGGWF